MTRFFMIFGSGFGVYGYLPALIANGYKVILPIRYKEKVIRRDDINSFAEKIVWSQNEEESLQMCSGVVIAKRPFEQEELINKILKYKNIKYIFLEKPLASTPIKAYEVQNKMINENKVFRIGYIFRYTSWGKELKNITKETETSDIEIKWNFMAHHYKERLHNWKRYDSDGGGVLRFYGIQLIALMVELGYVKMRVNNFIGNKINESESLNISFLKKEYPKVNIEINTKVLEEEFKVCVHKGLQKRNIFNSKSPFDANNSKIDSRVKYLEEHINTIKEEKINYYKWYDSVVDMWNEIEEKLNFANMLQH